MPHKSDPLNVDIQLRIKKGHDASLEKQQAVLRHWAGTGQLPTGYQVFGVTWTNPARSTTALAAPRQANSGLEIEEARLTLGRFLRQAPLKPGSRQRALPKPAARPLRRGD